LIVAGLFVFVFIVLVFTTFKMPSDSMAPTLRKEDVLLVNKIAYRTSAPHRGDIVVFLPPVETFNRLRKKPPSRI
jgi:signal peptidase I